MLSSKKHHHHPSEYKLAAKKDIRTIFLSLVFFIFCCFFQRNICLYFFCALVPLETIRDRTRVVDLRSVIRESLGLGDCARVVDLGSLDRAAVVDLGCHFCLLVVGLTSSCVCCKRVFGFDDLVWVSVWVGLG